MKTIFRFVLLVVSAVALMSCEKEDSALTYLIGQWDYDNVHISFNGKTYITQRDFFFVDDKPVPCPSVVTFNRGGGLVVDGLRGTFSWKRNGTSIEGTLDYNGMSQPFNMPYGILFLEEVRTNASSVTVNGSKATGSGDVKITYWLYKH